VQLLDAPQLSNKMSTYSKTHQKRQQSLFFPGPVDYKTGNFTKSPADEAGVKQWPKTKAEREKLEKFYRKHRV